MRVFTLCFRLLLVLTLLANSVGSASALARMTTMDAPAPEGSTTAPVTKHADCHEDLAGKPVPDQPAPAQPRDCCDGGVCACPCVGGPGSLIATLPALPAQALPAALYMDAAASPHRGAALPNLLRPPIGQA